jgi:hypothetical protein
MAVYKHYLVIFGGMLEVTKELEDCWIFNTKTKTFTELLGKMNVTSLISPSVSPARKSLMLMAGGSRSPPRNRTGSIRKG